MKYEKRHFVVVLPGNVRVCKDLEVRDERLNRVQDEVRQMAQQVVWAAKLTTPRKNPQAIKVVVSEQTILDGKIVETFFSQFEVPLPLEAMTVKEYQEEMDDALRSLPVEFKSFVGGLAADRGSSFEERVYLARDMANNLSQAVAEYEKRHNR